MSQEKSIVFCTTCKNRYQHLAETLPRNLADNNLPNTKFVVVDYNSGDDMERRIEADHAADIASGKLVYYKYYRRHPFRMAHAKNLAHRLGIMEGGDILVNLDADNYTGFNFDRYVQARFENIPDVFLWANMIKGVLPKGISGRIACSKDAFILAGGYDEKYETYSPDDKDFKARLIRLGFSPAEIDPFYLNAIKHNDKMRFKEYPEAADADAEDFQISQHNRVVNYGKIGLGRVTRNFSYELCSLRDVEPLPTRIFGVGMHKTATTSLHHAFGILGMKSAHWKDAHWAKAIWNQMHGTARSVVLEKNYALCDMPIPNLYRELDKAYPGSKFILTVRPELDWIESVRKHWDPEHNPQRRLWASDPFTRIIHRATYGQIGFDAEIFLQKYREHNAGVKLHFADRPDDLFVMEQNEWSGLCRFLGMSVPQEPYPSRNVTPK